MAAGPAPSDEGDPDWLETLEALDAIAHEETLVDLVPCPGPPPAARGDETHGVGQADSGSDAAGLGIAPSAGECTTQVQRRARRRVIAQQHRERKKAELAEMKKRSRELEEEQVLLRSRVMEIQGEIEALRYAGDVDLAMENELLRIEIKRHKVFVSQVLADAVHKMPSDSSPEAQYRLIHNGLESSKCSLLGLLYASARDPSWRSSPTDFQQEYSSHAAMRFQLLPTGVPREEASKLNFRLDQVLDLPVEFFASGFSQQHDHMMGEHESPFCDKVVRTDVTPASFRSVAKQIGAEESIVLIHRRDTYTTCAATGETVECESLAAQVWGFTDVSLHAVFPDYCHRFGVPTGSPARAVIFCLTNFAAVADSTALPHELLSRTSLCDPDEEPMLMGAVMCANPLNPEQTFMANLNSLPLAQPASAASAASSSTLLSRRDGFEADGSLHPALKANLEAQGSAWMARYELWRSQRQHQPQGQQGQHTDEQEGELAKAEVSSSS